MWLRISTYIIFMKNLITFLSCLFRLNYAIVSKLIILFLIIVVSNYTCNGNENYARCAIVRANIAHYVSGHKWLVYYEIKRGVEDNHIAQSEAIGFDAEGNFFRIKGQLRPNVTDLLSIGSYDKPIVTFNTPEGHVYHRNPSNAETLIPTIMLPEDYEEIIKKFETYPLLRQPNAEPYKFVLLDNSPEFYSKVIALPRPKPLLQLLNPSARRAKAGLSLTLDPVKRLVTVTKITPNSTAAEAGILVNDVITQVKIDGVTAGLDVLKNFPTNSKARLLTLTIQRTVGDKVHFLKNVNVYLPSPAESYILKFITL